MSKIYWRNIVAFGCYKRITTDMAQANETKMNYSAAERGAEENISPKINISAQPLKKGPAQDSRGAITRDSNISARTPQKVIFLHESQKKHFFLNKKLNLHVIHCFASFSMA